MADSHNLGIKGEDLATEYLTKSGYKILQRNWKWGKNEIDIIAEKDDMVVFIEVKTRTGLPLEHPRGAITVDKQKSIIYAADGYIRKFKIDNESRFDVLFIIMQDDKPEFELIDNAFYPTLR
jgi:putative endonuclease